MSHPGADRVRDVARLAGRSARSKRRSFLAEGPQAVREALRRHRSGTPTVEQVFATDEALARHPELAEPTDGVTLRRVTADVLAAMSDTVTPQGVVAVCRMLDVGLDDVLAGSPRLIAVLCQVRDPGNAGTVLRAADSAGADAVILTHGSVDLYNPKAVRSTVGSLFHLPVVLGVPFADLAVRLREAGVAVLAADGHGDADLDALQDASAARRLAGSAPDDEGTGPRLEAPTAWLFGNEAHGLAEEELTAADARVRVPVYGAAESLNVGTAATVCLYASARAQRR
ncbi:RNA methyltransferase [Tersicoccus solisilvae]|uniref:RNA methyltransferase n=1 Tax=Tersicoccus solisilvae TaxID=1882339 RepID=A0ABQ1PE70_9MICC|nr:RNA methyltransferase [Tersicoccus solisilvae]GGC95546.1 RNA methyltransferase [Tersicoccus solisilvae]